MHQSAALSEEDLESIGEQVAGFMERNRFQEALSLCEMAVSRAAPELRGTARYGYAMTLNQVSKAHHGTQAFRPLAERNYERVKELIQANMAESASWWSMQVAALFGGILLAYDYTGPRGLMASIATIGLKGNPNQLIKLSDDSYARISEDLRLLTEYGQRAVQQDGGVTDEDLAMAGEIALTSVNHFTGGGRPAPVWALKFFAELPDDNIAFSDEQTLKRLTNMRRSVQARLMTR